MTKTTNSMITIGTAIAVSAAANAAVHVYRQDLPTPTCVQDHFKVELDPDKPTTGPSYRVETDSAGRLLRLDAMRDGKVLSGYRVRFGKTGSMAIFAFFSAGKPTSEQRCVRDAGGTLTRTDVVSAAGVLTEYDLFSPVYSPRSALETWTAYTPRGNKAKTETDYFNIDGVLTRVRSQNVGETSYRVTEFDPDTGLAQTRRVFDTSSRQLKQTFKFTYDRSGDRTRADIFDAKGARYGSMQYVAGLETRQQYQRANGTSEVYDFDYDHEHRLTDAKLKVNGKIICELVYNRRPDGAVSRTEAHAPDGTLWARYPGRTVQEVAIDGRDPTGAVSTVYRRGNWW